MYASTAAVSAANGIETFGRRRTSKSSRKRSKNITLKTERKLLLRMPSTKGKTENRSMRTNASGAKLTPAGKSDCKVAAGESLASWGRQDCIPPTNSTVSVQSTPIIVFAASKCSTASDLKSTTWFRFRKEAQTVSKTSSLFAGNAMRQKAPEPSTFALPSGGAARIITEVAA